MSSGSDPTDVRDALDRAQDAFEMVGRGRAEFETGISDGDDWETQLTKACRLIEVTETLQAEGGYYTAVIEVSFGAVERSIEAYALAMTNDSLQDFQDHQFAYARARNRPVHQGDCDGYEESVQREPDRKLLRRWPSDERTSRRNG